MFRFYWNDNKTEKDVTEEIIRTDGGWWFSEDTSNGRFVYEVIERKEISPCCFLEYLKPLNQDFLQLPCWKEAPQLWKIHHEENQVRMMSCHNIKFLQWPEPLLGQSLTALVPALVQPGLALVPALGQPGLAPVPALGQPGLAPVPALGQPVLAPGPALGQPGLALGSALGQPVPASVPALGQPGLSLEQTLPSLELHLENSLSKMVLKEVGHLHNIIQKEVRRMIFSNQPNLPNCLQLRQEQQEQPPLHEQQQVKIVQKLKISENRKEQKELLFQHDQSPSLKFQEQASFSDQGKDLKMGILCSPSFLPDEQSPRVLHYHPSKPQKPRLQGHYKHQQKCLIMQE